MSAKLENIILERKTLSGGNYDALIGFVKNFNLKLVHIHANNHGLVDLEKKIPLVLELTFSKYCELNDQLELPHPLDMRNGNNREEINLEFLK